MEQTSRSVLVSIPCPCLSLQSRVLRRDGVREKKQISRNSRTRSQLVFYLEDSDAFVYRNVMMQWIS